jgi:hypothetical protein
MRTLPAALTAAQRARSRQPYLQVDISNRFPDAVAPIWTNLYTGAEADGPHAAAAATNGSPLGWLTRLHILSNTLYRHTTDLITWPAWTNWRAATRLCAIAATDYHLAAFAVDNATPTTIYLSESSDGGVNWSAFALAITHTSTITNIAAARKSNGDLCVIVNDGTEIAAYRRVATVWQAKVVSAIAATVTGLAIKYEGDWNCVVTGAITGRTVVGRVLFGDGYSAGVGVWSPLLVIASAITGANVAYTAPSVAYPDCYRITFRENYTGTVAYDRVKMTTLPYTGDFVDDCWREPTPIAQDQTYGLILIASPVSPYPMYLCSPSKVDTASVVAYSIDVTADVLSADVNQADINHPSTSTIVLDNSSGRYNTLGSGANIAIRKGARIAVAPGYNALHSDGPAYWIVGLHHTYPKKGGVATLTIIADDAWHFLARWTAPTTYTFPGTKNVYQLYAFLLGRLGFEAFSAGSSPDMTDLHPQFTITAGTTGLAALRALFRLVPDVLFNRAGFIYARWPQASDASLIPYAWNHNPTTQHEISAADYHDDMKDSNHQRVIAGPLANIIGDRLDLADIGLFYASAHQVAASDVTTGALATARAEAEQRRVDIPARSDIIVTPVHCGVEPTDPIDITDSRLGLATAKRRVLAIKTRYQRDRPCVYEHHLTLGAV